MISRERFCEGIESIYAEKPAYELGHDGSDGKCDCIGMPRGALEREGVKNVTNMRGTNQAARKTIKNLQELESADQLMLGDVVLKTRDKDDPDMPLPDRYRKGGSDYDERWRETNFTHIGTVTRTDPVEITHMTSPTAKKTTSLKGWKFFGELPWVEYEAAPEPQPEPVSDIAIVVAENGNSVKMRAKPTQSCDLYWNVPIGSEVEVFVWNASTDSKGQVWSSIQWAGQSGYMMKEFLQDEDESETTYTVTIPGLTEREARKLLAVYPNATMEEERS